MSFVLYYLQKCYQLQHEVILNLMQHVQYVTNYRLLAVNSYNVCNRAHVKIGMGWPHTIQNLTQVTHNKKCTQLLYLRHVDTTV